MKLDALFNVINNQLFKIEDNSPVDISKLKKIEIKWSTVELEEESYNEEFLAELRDNLKSMEAAGEFAVIIPVIDKDFSTPEHIELFTNAFNHTARRVKDCISVAGMELPLLLIKDGVGGGSPAADFIEVLAKKHAQYIYFASSDNVKNANLSDKIQNSDIVVY